MAVMDLIEVQKWSYLPDLPQAVGPIRELLQDYSSIPAQDVDNHLQSIRQKAWETSSMPCIGRWKFLRLADREDAQYQHILFRLTLPKSKDTLLDLGCCLGQTLRQLRADGVDGSQLFGTDLSSDLVDIGYELFQDKESLDATFVIGDMIDPDDSQVSLLEGRITIIQANSFFHLFNWTQQLYIGKRIVSFLKAGTRNAIIFGRHAGTLKQEPASRGRRSPYLHTQETFQTLWNEIGRITNTRWAVEFEPDGELSPDLPGFEKDIVPIRFTVHQVS